MFSVVKDKSNRIKQFLGEENCTVVGTNEKSNMKNFSDTKKPPFQDIKQKIISNELFNVNELEDSQTINCRENESRDEVISVFVKTSQRLQNMVRGYEAKVNQTTAHITCLQHHIFNLHEQLAYKNKTIRRICERYLVLSKEKKIADEHLQNKIEQLSSVLEACVNNNSSQLQQLLKQQIERNRYLEYQNEILSQRVTELTCPRALMEPKIKLT